MSEHKDIQSITKAHFVGLGGIGMSAILRLFAARGIFVSGSDLNLPPIETLPMGEFYPSHDAAHVPTDASLLIYSAAVPDTNPERKRARELGITEMSYPEALAFVTAPYTTIAVSGTHGKSTSTALLGKLFEAGNLHPSVIVGAEVPGWKDHNLLRGEGDVFIVEACEYRRHMLNLTPQTIVLTNLELDHPDYYRDLEDIKSAFKEYIDKLGGEGLLVANNDDANIRDIMRGFDGIVVTFGVGSGADLVAKNIRGGRDRQVFELVWKGAALGEFTTPLPGLYNIYNILSACAAYLAYSGKSEAIQGVLDAFHGVGRRFEVVGMLGNTIIVSDYAHHPTALRAVVEAALARYKDKRILTIFRPHQRERTQKLFDQFVAVMGNIPALLLIEIYDVAGREEGIDISSRDLIASIQERFHNPQIIYAKDLIEAEQIARIEAEHFDVMLVVGAGDADQLAYQLVT